MGSTIVAAITGAVIGSLASLLGTWLQSYLGRRQTQEHSLLEARRVAYSRLLFAVISEDTYPPEYMPSVMIGTKFEDEIGAHNEKLRLWRKGRRELKAVATEALLLAKEDALRDKLKEFIQSNNPDHRLTGIEAIMREELDIDL